MVTMLTMFTSKEIIERLGGPSEVAKICECTPQAVSQWFGKDQETGLERDIPNARLMFLRLLRPEVFELSEKAGV